MRARNLALEYPSVVGNGVSDFDAVNEEDGRRVGVFSDDGSSVIFVCTRAQKGAE